jgi:hypothetical protein
MNPTGSWVLICKALWTLLRGSLMHTFDPLCVSKWFTGCKPGNTQRDDPLLLLNDQMEWFRRYYGIISDGVVTVGIRAFVCIGVIRLILITWFTTKLSKIDWILKIRWIIKEWSRSRGPRGNFGFFKVAYESMVYFANFQHLTLCQTYFLVQPN